MYFVFNAVILIFFLGLIFIYILVPLVSIGIIVKKNNQQHKGQHQRIEFIGIALCKAFHERSENL